jgi:hypothetical protein
MEENIAYVRGPTGELGTIPAGELQMALANGYAQVSPEELAQNQREEEFGSGTQQLMAGLEGAASAATFGLSTGVQTALGADPENIQARREVNPGSYMLGQGAGVLGSVLIPGVGAANVLTKAGAGAAKLAGLAAPTTTLAKIGSGAVKAATENMLFQSGDELSKMFAQDPYQSVETAAVNIGLSGIIGAGAGAGIGAVSPLWKATAGGKVGEILDFVKNKAGGIDGTIDDAVHDATQKLGLDLSPEVKASLSDDPWIQSAAKGLQQTDTTATGRTFQEKMTGFKKELNNSVLAAFGQTPESLPQVQELSKAQFGKQIGESLAGEIDARISPLAKEFEDLKVKYKDVELPKDQKVLEQDLATLAAKETMVPGTASQLSERVSQIAVDNGWTSFNDSEIMNLVNKVQRNLPRQKSLKNLSDFISQVGAEANKDALNFELKRAGELIKGVLREGEADLIMGALGKEGPELVERYAGARAAWGEQARLIDSIDDRIKLGGSKSRYAKNLKELATVDGEKLVQRLSGKGDADLLRVLQENFPQTAQAVKQFHLDEVLKKAADKAKPGEEINPKVLIDAIKNMSPELRAFAIPDEILKKVDAVATITEQLAKAPHNFSNSARTMDKMFEYIPATAVGMATLVAGGNPLMAGALGALTKYLSKDAPDAVKMALLKFMASGQPIEAGAFKSTVDIIEQTIKGENAVNSSVRRVFKTGREVLPSSTDKISENKREKLDKQVVAMMSNPEGLMGVGGEAGYYLPEHATAITATAGNVVSYLASVRPNTDPQNPLDEPIEPNAVQKAKYNRALDIAEQPLIVLNDVKDGTLTLNDVQALNSMYPALYSKLKMKFMDEIVSLKQKKESMPYKMKMSLSLFLGQPLDSSLTAESILANQPKNVITPVNMMPGAGVQKLNKFAELEASSNQAREMKNRNG